MINLIPFLPLFKFLAGHLTLLLMIDFSMVGYDFTVIQNAL